jgi:hypothetical protein
MKASGKTSKSLGGRPRKFEESSKPVTVTLPDRILRLLTSVDTDRAKAIVKIADAMVSEAWPDKQRVKLAVIDPGTAVIVVGPSASLAKIPWLKLVEIGPARYLLSIPSGTATERLELAIADLLEELSSNDEYERSLLEELHRQIGRLRKQDRMSKSEIILVST